MSSSTSTIKSPGQDALEDIAAAQQYVLDLQVLFYSLKTVAANSVKEADARAARGTGESGGATAHEAATGVSAGRSGAAASRPVATITALQGQVKELTRQLEEERREKERVQEQYQRATAMLRKSYGQIVDDYLFATEQLHERTRQLELLVGTAPAAAAVAAAPLSPGVSSVSGRPMDSLAGPIHAADSEQAAGALHGTWFPSASLSNPFESGGLDNTGLEGEPGGMSVLGMAGASRTNARQRLFPGVVDAAADGTEAEATSCFASSAAVAALAVAGGESGRTARGGSSGGGGGGGSVRSSSGTGRSGLGADLPDRTQVGDPASQGGYPSMQSPWLPGTHCEHAAGQRAHDSAGWGQQAHRSSPAGPHSDRDGGGTAVAGTKRAASPVDFRRGAFSAEASSLASETAYGQQPDGYKPLESACQGALPAGGRPVAKTQTDPAAGADGVTGLRQVESKVATRARQPAETQYTGEEEALARRHPQHQQQHLKQPQQAQRQHEQKSARGQPRDDALARPTTYEGSGWSGRSGLRAAESPPSGTLRSPLASGAGPSSGASTPQAPVNPLSPASTTSPFSAAATAALRTPTSTAPPIASPAAVPDGADGLLRGTEPHGRFPAPLLSDGDPAAPADTAARNPRRHTNAVAADRATAAAAAPAETMVKRSRGLSSAAASERDGSQAARHREAPTELEAGGSGSSGDAALPSQPSTGARDAAAVLEAASRSAQAAARAAAAKAARAVAELTAPQARWTFQSRHDKDRTGVAQRPVEAHAGSTQPAGAQDASVSAEAALRRANHPVPAAGPPSHSSRVDEPESSLPPGRRKNSKDAGACGGGGGGGGEDVGDVSSPSGRRAGSVKRLRRSVSSPSERPSPRRSSRDHQTVTASGATPESRGGRHASSSRGPTRPVPPSEPPSSSHVTLRHVGGSEQQPMVGGGPGGPGSRGRSLRYAHSAPSPERAVLGDAAGAGGLTKGPRQVAAAAPGVAAAAAAAAGQAGAPAIGQAAAASPRPRSEAATGAGQRSAHGDTAPPFEHRDGGSSTATTAAAAAASGPAGAPGAAERARPAKPLAGAAVATAAASGSHARTHERHSGPSSPDAAATAHLREGRKDSGQHHRPHAYPNPANSRFGGAPDGPEAAANGRDDLDRPRVGIRSAYASIADPGPGQAAAAAASAAAAAAAAATEAAAPETPTPPRPPGGYGAVGGVDVFSSRSSSSSLEGLASLVRDLKAKLAGLQQEAGVGALDDDEGEEEEEEDRDAGLYGIGENFGKDGTSDDDDDDEDYGGEGDDDNDDEDLGPGFGLGGLGVDADPGTLRGWSPVDDLSDDDEIKGFATAATAAARQYEDVYDSRRNQFGMFGTAQYDEDDDDDDDVDGDDDTCARLPGGGSGGGGASGTSRTAQYGPGRGGRVPQAHARGGGGSGKGEGDATRHGLAGTFASAFVATNASANTSGAATPRGAAGTPASGHPERHGKGGVGAATGPSPRNARRGGSIAAEGRTPLTSLLDAVNTAALGRGAGVTGDGSRTSSAGSAGRTAAAAAVPKQRTSSTGAPGNSSSSSGLHGCSVEAGPTAGGWAGGVDARWADSCGGTQPADRTAPPDQTSPRKAAGAAFTRAGKPAVSRWKAPLDAAAAGANASNVEGLLGNPPAAAATWTTFGGSAENGVAQGASAPRADTAGASGAAAAAAAAASLQGLRSDAMFARIKQQLDDLQSTFAQGLGLGSGRGSGGNTGVAAANASSAGSGLGFGIGRSSNSSSGDGGSAAAATDANSASGGLGRGTVRHAEAEVHGGSRGSSGHVGGGEGTRGGARGGGSGGDESGGAFSGQEGHGQGQGHGTWRRHDRTGQPGAGAGAAVDGQAAGASSAERSSHGGSDGTAGRETRGAEPSGLDAWRHVGAGGVTVTGH